MSSLSRVAKVVCAAVLLVYVMANGHAVAAVHVVDPGDVGNQSDYPMFTEDLIAPVEWSTWEIRFSDMKHVEASSYGVVMFARDDFTPIIGALEFRYVLTDENNQEIPSSARNFMGNINSGASAFPAGEAVVGETYSPLNPITAHGVDLSITTPSQSFIPVGAPLRLEIYVNGPVGEWTVPEASSTVTWFLLVATTGTFWSRRRRAA